MMLFGTFIAMCKEKGITDSTNVGTIMMHDEGYYAPRDFHVDVWPEDRAGIVEQPKTINFKLKRPEERQGAT